MNLVLLIGAGIAFVAAALALALIHQRDFVASTEEPGVSVRDGVTIEARAGRVAA